VIVIPDDNRMAVFRRGVLNGFSGLIPVGGQHDPSSSLGASLVWMRAQNNEKKKRISDTINRSMPSFKLFTM